MNKIGTICIELSLWEIVKELLRNHKFTINSIIQHRESYSSIVSGDSSKVSILDSLLSENQLVNNGLNNN